MRRKKIPKGTLILAGLAAIAYYKYSKLSEEQKDNLINTLKEKGRKFYDQYIPSGIKNLFTKKQIRGRFLHFFERCGKRAHFKLVPYTAFQGEIIFLVTHREIKTNRVLVFTHLFKHDLVNGAAELLSRIIGLDFKTAYYERFQS